MSKLVTAGLVLVGLADVAWILPFGGAPLDSLMLVVGAAGAFAAAWKYRVGGMIALTFSWAYFAASFFLLGQTIDEWVVALLVAAGLAAASWGMMGQRAGFATAGFAVAGLVQVYWIYENLVSPGGLGFVPGNALLSIGALLAAVGEWRAPETVL